MHWDSCDHRTRDGNTSASTPRGLQSRGLRAHPEWSPLPHHHAGTRAEGLQALQPHLGSLGGTLPGTAHPGLSLLQTPPSLPVMNCRCSHPMWLLMGHVLFHPGSEVTIEHVRGRRGTSTSRPSPAQLPGREQGPRSQDGLPRASLSLDLTLLHAQSEQRHSHLYRNASCRPSCPLQRQAAGT